MLMGMTSSTPAIRLEKLHKQYKGVLALDHIELEVRSGEFFGLLGPNGAGKTTTINILAGLCNKTSGEAFLFGHDLVREYRACRRLVGLVPQEFNFDIFAKVRKILMFQGGYFGMSKADRSARADELMEEFELADKADAPARMLSGGMKRRLMIARALMHRPRLLILDEPTAGVDVDLRKSTWKLMRRLNREGTTIILTTHYLEEAESLCDRIGIIQHGRIIANETTRSLLNKLVDESILITATEPASDELVQALGAFKPQRGSDPCDLGLTYDRTRHSLEDVLAALRDAGISIAHIRPVENRLERVFLQLTRSRPHE